MKLSFALFTLLCALSQVCADGDDIDKRQLPCPLGSVIPSNPRAKFPGYITLSVQSATVNGKIYPLKARFVPIHLSGPLKPVAPNVRREKFLLGNGILIGDYGTSLGVRNDSVGVNYLAMSADDTESSTMTAVDVCSPANTKITVLQFGNPTDGEFVSPVLANATAALAPGSLLFRPQLPLPGSLNPGAVNIIVDGK